MPLSPCLLDVNKFGSRNRAEKYEFLAKIRKQEKYTTPRTRLENMEKGHGP